MIVYNGFLCVLLLFFVLYNFSALYFRFRIVLWRVEVVFFGVLPVLDSVVAGLRVVVVFLWRKKKSSGIFTLFCFCTGLLNWCIEVFFFGVLPVRDIVVADLRVVVLFLWRKKKSSGIFTLFCFCTGLRNYILT